MFPLMIEYDSELPFIDSLRSERLPGSFDAFGGTGIGDSDVGLDWPGWDVKVQRYL